jgi:hypothetical protein
MEARFTPAVLESDVETVLVPLVHDGSTEIYKLLTWSIFPVCVNVGRMAEQLLLWLVVNLIGLSYDLNFLKGQQWHLVCKGGSW